MSIQRLHAPLKYQQELAPYEARQVFTADYVDKPLDKHGELPEAAMKIDSHMST